MNASPKSIPVDLKELKFKTVELDKLQKKIASTGDPLKVDKFRRREVDLKLEIKRMARNIRLEF